MTPAQLGLIIIQVVVSGAVLLYIAAKWLVAREQQQAYKLYALRDRLIYLVVDGKLSQSDMLFKTFYNALAKSISELDGVTFYALVKASISAKTALQKNGQDDGFKAAIQSADPEVREFVIDFANSMMRLMLANSPALHVLLFSARWCGNVLARFKKWTKVPTNAEETYRAYQYFQGIEALAH